MPARKATIEKIRKENRKKYEKLQKKERANKKKEQSKIANREKTLCKKKYVAAYLPWIFNIAPNAVQWRSRGGEGRQGGRYGV